MDIKQDIIINLSIILNRGICNESELVFFTEKKHDDLVKDLTIYIDKHKKYIGHTKLDFSQALNDHGVDLLLKVNKECRIGFQVKSFSDVQKKDFNQHVKKQMTESLYHHLDKWYLIICSPYEYKENYTEKINYLINEFNCYSRTSNYHCVFSPQTALNIFKSDVLTEKEFLSSKSLYNYGNINNEQMKKLFTSENIVIKDNSIIKEEQYKKLYSIYKEIKKFIEGLRSNEDYSIIVTDESIENILKYLDKCNFEFFLDDDIISIIKDLRMNVYKLKNNGLMFSFLKNGNIIKYLKLKNKWNDEAAERFEDNEFHKWDSDYKECFIQNEESTDFEDIAHCIIDNINKNFEELVKKIKDVFN